MSLSGTWVKAQDGHWYEDPVIEAEDKSWFVCFDDDEPPELVMREHIEVPKLDFFHPTNKVEPCGDRIFDVSRKTVDIDTMFWPAKRQFGMLTKRIPVPDRYSDKSETEDRPDRCMCWMMDPEA